MTRNMKKSMKNNVKKYIAAALISVTAFSMLTGCGSRDIGKDEATRIALEDAGFTESDVTRLYVSKDRDDGRTIYEVKFTSENTEYDYEVQASDGDIISCDMEETKQNNSQTQQAQQAQTDQQTQTDQQAQSGQNADTSQNNGQSTSNVQITQDEAVKLALDRVPGATEQDIWIELDYDDGYYKYEGDIIYNQKEYEFEIDANTGTFLEWSEERR